MAAKKDSSIAAPVVSDKKKALETAMQQIEKTYGKGSIMRYGDNVQPNVEAIPTGSLALDLALGIGGVPRGRIIEIYGPESSGKTTLALHVLAQAQKMGGEVAFVDAEHALDPTYARALGVKIEDMLISQPDTGEQALEITEALVRSGAIGTGDQSGHGVHHHHVDGAGADQGLGDFQGLLAGVRLGDQHILDPHAQGPGIGGIQGVLGVHKGHLAAQLLGLGQNVQGQGGLTGGLRPVDLDDAPPGHAADAQGQVQGQGAGGDGLHVGLGVFAVSHDGALAVHLLDLLHGRLQGLFFVGTRRDCGGRILFRCHFRLLL